MKVIRVKENPEKKALVKGGYCLSFIVECEDKEDKKDKKDKEDKKDKRVDEVYYKSGWEGNYPISGDKHSGTSLIFDGSGAILIRNVLPQEPSIVSVITSETTRTKGFSLTAEPFRNIRNRTLECAVAYAMFLKKEGVGNRVEIEARFEEPKQEKIY